MAKINIKGVIMKVVRQNGKVEAGIVIAVPAAVSVDIPMGEVLLTIEPVQKSIEFGAGKAGKK